MLGHCSTVIVRDSENSRSISQDSSLCSTYFFCAAYDLSFEVCRQELTGRQDLGFTFTRVS